jgi:hypothetical protein
MRRILLVLTVAVVTAAMLAATGGNAWAVDPLPEPPSSVHDGYDAVPAIQDEENRDAYGDGNDAVAIQDSEREAVFFRGGV